MLKKSRDKTALLVIDMQNAYLHPEGSFTKLGLDVTPLREASLAQDEPLCGAEIMHERFRHDRISGKWIDHNMLWW
jgi:nicotinamidase-related amidase